MQVFYVIQPIVTGQLGKNSTGKVIEQDGKPTSDFDAILHSSVETGKSKEVNVEILGLLAQVVPFASQVQTPSSSNILSEITKKLPDQSALIETPLLVPELLQGKLPPQIQNQIQNALNENGFLEKLQGQIVKNTASLENTVQVDNQTLIGKQQNIEAIPNVEIQFEVDNSNAVEAPSEGAEFFGSANNQELSSESDQQEQSTNAPTNSIVMVEDVSNANETQTFIHSTQPHTQQAPQDIQNKPAGINTTVTVTQFEQDITKFMESAVRVENLGDGVEATFSLSPEHLGNVDVKLSIIDGNVTAEFFTSTVSGRELLEFNVQALRTALETQGFQVEKINISQQNLSSFMGSFSQKGESNGKQAQQDSKKRQVQNIQNLDKEYQNLDLDSGTKINTTA